MPSCVRARSNAHRVLIALLLGGVVSASGCRVDASVRIEVESRGSGVVTVTVDLDKAAAGKLGDEAAEVRVADLSDAGWEVAGPVKRRGLVSFSAHKRFSSPRALQGVLDEIAGDGVFRDWRVTVEDGFASTTRSATGRVRLTGDLNQFGDADLAAVLDGFAVGRTGPELIEALGADRDAVNLEVAVELPDGPSDRIETVVGSGSVSEDRLATSSTEWDTSALRWFGLALVTASCGAVVVFVGRRRSRVRVRSTDP